MDAFFFSTADELRLFGVARGPQNAARVWILCPPFAEEEKSSRRFFTLLSQKMEDRNQASLLFSFRGTGDSEGDFSQATLSAWKRDLRATKNEAQRRFPAAEIAFLGVRLGASLAWQEAQQLEVGRLILIEPLMSGRSFLRQQSAKKMIRAQLTGAGSVAPIENPESEDLDGWELGKLLKSEMEALDLRREMPRFSGAMTFFQVGPKAEIAPPLQSLTASTRAKSAAIVMAPFWNLIDAPDYSPLLQAVQSEIDDE